MNDHEFWTVLKSKFEQAESAGQKVLFINAEDAGETLFANRGLPNAATQYIMSTVHEKSDHWRVFADIGLDDYTIAFVDISGADKNVIDLDS